MWQDITQQDKKEYNSVVTHPLQSYEWGEFRKATGLQIVRKGFFLHRKLIEGFTVTLHPIPHTRYFIGYLPKGILPTEHLVQELKKIGQQYHCIFMQLEPNISDNKKHEENLLHLELVPSAHPLFTRYTFQLNLALSEDDLLKNMHQKTRYNIKVAQKHGVVVSEDNSEEAFEVYWKLMQETTSRQHFFAHTKKYHELLWQTLKNKNPDGLQAQLFIARYKTENNLTVPLAAWMLFTFQDKLYYPYGSSSNQYRNVMASNLMMWEAILFGKKSGLNLFDMWGSLGENPDTKDPWYGFHRLKMGYGPQLVKFIGSYDLIINSKLYTLYKIADKIRWTVLKIIK